MSETINKTDESVTSKDLYAKYSETKKELAGIVDSATDKSNDNAWINWDKAAAKFKEATGTEITASDLRQRTGKLRQECDNMADELFARHEAEKYRQTLEKEVFIPEKPKFALSKEDEPNDMFDVLASNESKEFQKQHKAKESYVRGYREEFSKASIQDFYAAVNTTANTISVNRPRDDGRVVMYNDPMIPIHQRLTVVRPIAGGDAYQYIKEKGAGGYESGDKKNNTTANTAEGANYAEQEYDTGNVTIVVKKVTGFSAITDEQLSDVRVARRFAQSRLVKNLRQRIENQVINGTGSNNQWTGLLTQGNIQTVTKTGTIKKLDIFIDAYQKEIGVAYVMPNVLAMPSATLVTFAKLKDADGNYIWSNVISGMPTHIFGVPTTISEHLPANTGLMLNTDEFAFLDKQGLIIDWGMNADDFRKGQQSVRASCRGNVIAWRENAAIKIANLNVADAA